MNLQQFLRFIKHLRTKSCAWLFTVARHTCQARAGENSSPFKVCNFVVVKIFPLSNKKVSHKTGRVTLQRCMNKPRSTLVFILISLVGAFFGLFCLHAKLFESERDLRN